jgi:hypothetical protein
MLSGEKKKPRGTRIMKTPHPEFGGAGVMQEICDRASCCKPITLAWPGREGRYCSNECLEAVEIEGELMTTTENGNTATTATPVAPPIVAGKPTAKKKTAAPAKKAPAKKTAAPAKKAAPVKKAAVKKAASNGEYAPRTGTKMESLVKLMQRSKGATLAELSEAAGFQAGAAIHHLRSKGLDIQKGDDDRYKIVA